MQTSRALPESIETSHRPARVPATAVALALSLSVAAPANVDELYDRAMLKPIADVDARATSAATTISWSAQTEQLRQIESRLAELRTAAAEDALPWSDASESALRRFLNAYRQPARPMIVLLDNGNLRAIWKDVRERHVGLQFLDNDIIQYVVIARRSGANFASLAAGRDGIDGVVAQIGAMGLLDLIAA